MRSERHRRGRLILTRALLPASLLLAFGCQSEPTDFLQRTAEDCRGGDAGACELLTDLRQSGSGDATPKPARAPATPVQRDVDAIMEGMRHAKTAPRPPQPAAVPSDSGPSDAMPSGAMPSDRPAAKPASP